MQYVYIYAVKKINRALVDRYGISVSQMTTDMFHLSGALAFNPGF